MGGLPLSCPKVALRSETGLLSMKRRVWREKIMFVHHLKGLKEDSLAHQVYKVQLENGWPGLVKETKEMCE